MGDDLREIAMIRWCRDRETRRKYWIKDPYASGLTRLIGRSTPSCRFVRKRWGSDALMLLAMRRTGLGAGYSEKLGLPGRLEQVE